MITKSVLDFRIAYYNKKKIILRREKKEASYQRVFEIYNEIKSCNVAIKELNRLKNYLPTKTKMYE